MKHIDQLPLVNRRTRSPVTSINSIRNSIYRTHVLDRTDVAMQAPNDSIAKVK